MSPSFVACPRDAASSSGSGAGRSQDPWRRESRWCSRRRERIGARRRRLVKRARRRCPPLPPHRASHGPGPRPGTPHRVRGRPRGRGDRGRGPRGRSLDGVVPLFPRVAAGERELRDHPGRRHSGGGVRRPRASRGAPRVLAAHRGVRTRRGTGEEVPIFGIDLVGDTTLGETGSRPRPGVSELIDVPSVWVTASLGVSPATPSPSSPATGGWTSWCRASSSPRPPAPGASSSWTSPSPSGSSPGGEGSIGSTCTPPPGDGLDWTDRLVPHLPPAASILPAGTRTDDNRRMLRAFRWNLRMMSYTTILVGAFLIYNTITAYVVRRRQQIGIARALGASRAMVRIAFLIEGAVFGAIGAVAGLLLGRVLAVGAVEAVGGTVSSLYVSSTPGEIAFSASTVATGLVAGLGMSLLSAWWPAREAAAVAPTEAMARAPTRLFRPHGEPPVRGRGPRPRRPRRRVLLRPTGGPDPGCGLPRADSPRRGVRGGFAAALRRYPCRRRPPALAPARGHCERRGAGPRRLPRPHLGDRDRDGRRDRPRRQHGGHCRQLPGDGRRLASEPAKGGLLREPGGGRRPRGGVDDERGRGRAARGSAGGGGRRPLSHLPRPPRRGPRHPRARRRGPYRRHGGSTSSTAPRRRRCGAPSRRARA